MEINKIYNENCLDTMKRMSDDFVDIVKLGVVDGDGVIR